MRFFTGRSDIGASEPQYKSPLALGQTRSQLPVVELFLRLADIAHMSARPGTERLDGAAQGAAHLGQLVIHARRNGGEDSSSQESIALQSSQGERQHALRDA